MLKRIVAGAILLGATSVAQAATLTFTGEALPACSLTSPLDGTLILSAGLNAWSTLTPATIVATNTAPATLTVTRSNSWTSAPANTPTTTFSHASTIAGANVGTLLGTGAQSGALTALGITTVSVALSASAVQPFRAGIHSAQVTVTCSVP